MGTPRIRDVITFVTTLPASVVIAVCLFLPHTETCSNRVTTPLESGTWIVIAPLLAFGLLPFLWWCAPRVHRALPELALAFTLIVLAMFVVTIPVAIYLMWGYSKRTFRGELLVAMCGVACVTLWLFFYPFITIFTDWLPAAHWTWGAAIAELVGLMAWGSASTARVNSA